VWYEIYVRRKSGLLEVRMIVRPRIEIRTWFFFSCLGFAGRQALPRSGLSWIYVIETEWLHKIFTPQNSVRGLNAKYGFQGLAEVGGDGNGVDATN